jgi:hypothetical protein
MPIALHVPEQLTCLRAVATVVPAGGNHSAASTLVHRRRKPLTLVVTMHDPGPQEGA